MTDPHDINWLRVGLQATGGLVLFLHGMGVMSDALKELAGERMKRVLARFTSNRFAGVATGAAATAALDSSSATTILTVGLVDAGLLSLRQALGVVLGANIGTTLSSQVIALDVTEYAPVGLLAGFLVRALSPSERWRQWGTVALGFGLLFFGLHLIERAVHPLRDHEGFVGLLRQLENPLYGVAAGALVTAVIMSSSATVGIAIALASEGVLSLPAGVAVMMGAEVGTCLDTLVSTVGRSRAAVKTGLFQLAFNLASVALFVGLAGELAALAAWLTPGAGRVGRQIANAHVLFNVLSVLAFVGLTDHAAALLHRLVPERRPEPQPA